MSTSALRNAAAFLGFWAAICIGCAPSERAPEMEDYESLCDKAEQEVKNREAYKAVFLTDRAVRLDPAQGRAYLIRGRARWALEHVFKAIEDFSSFIEREPRKPDGYFYRGLMLAREQRMKEALADFSKTIELDPRHARAYMQRGYVRLELGEYQASILDLDRSLEIEPDEPRAHYFRITARMGLLSARSAALAQALSEELVAMDRAMGAHPKNLDWYLVRALAKSMLAGCDRVRAVELLKSAKAEVKMAISMDDGSWSRRKEADELNLKIDQMLEELTTEKF